MTTRAQAAAARAAQVRQATDRPSQRRSAADPGALAVVRGRLLVDDVRKAKADDGTQTAVVRGYAYVSEQAYDMWDLFGVYSEIVTQGAAETTLARSPLVEWVVNHGAGGGLPMAHTRNGTLALSEDDEGLLYEATVDLTRGDVADAVKAIERGDLAESSFKFRIDSGRWSPDYSEYRIDAVDLDRGDVSAVNFGANPHTADLLGVARQAEAPAVERTSPELLAARLRLALARG